MREIKFSYIAQHEETGLFMEQIFTMEEIEGSDFLNQWRKTFKRFGKWIARRQFTGLKDKNGKEIYEGDLLIDTDPEPCRHRIVWLEDRAKFELETLLEDGDWDSGLYDNLEYYPEGKENKLTEFEVIGNIYENPELIKK